MTFKNYEETPFDQDMFILTNKPGCYGAAYLICPDVLKGVSEKIKGDFLLLPSSMHEFIIVKERADTDIKNCWRL